MKSRERAHEGERRETPWTASTGFLTSGTLSDPPEDRARRPLSGSRVQVFGGSGSVLGGLSGLPHWVPHSGGTGNLSGHEEGGHPRKGAPLGS